MKRTVAGLVLLGFCVSATAGDRQLKLFDRAQELLATAEERESQLIVEIDPSLASFQAQLSRFDGLDRKIERICITLALEHSPRDIDWSNPYTWGAGVTSSKNREALSKENEQLKSLLDELASMKQDLREQEDGWKRSNAIRRENRNKFSAIETEVHERLMALQKEMDALLESAQPEPKPGG